MVDKLSLKLTLFNIIIISSIILIVFLFFFAKSPDTVSKRINDTMKEALSSNVSGEKNSYILRNCNIIKVGSGEKIIEKFLHIDISDKELNEVVNNISISKKSNGEIKTASGYVYIFLKISDDNNGYSAAFMDMEMKNQIFNKYIIEIFIIVVVVLSLVISGSLFITRSSLKPIKESIQKQINFTSDASHELRTSLAVIQSNVELVLENKEETVLSQKKWLSNIQVENKRMAVLVDDLLTLSRADSGQNLLYITNFMIGESFYKIIESYKPLALSNNVTLNYNYDKQVIFSGDENRLHQLLVILIDNAVKYSKGCGIVEINLINKDKYVKINVSDEGIGIDKININRIFDRFYREENEKNSKTEGSGLGLSIAKWIIDEHKGTVKVESFLGKGTKFFISIPKKL